MNVGVAEQSPNAEQHDSHAAAEIPSVNCEAELKRHQRGHADMKLSLEHSRDPSTENEDDRREQKQPRNHDIKCALWRQQQKYGPDQAAGDACNQSSLERYSFQ